MPTSSEELVAKYRTGVEHFDRRLFELSEAQLDTAFLPEAGVGRWPVRVLLGHVADAELVFTHRMRRALGEENPVVALWDEDSFVDSGIYSGAPIAGFIATIHTLRRWTSEWLSGLSESQMGRRILHPDKGPMSVHQILVYATWHLEHHAEFLKKKLDRMLGPAKAGGCGPGCGCGGGQ
jgi:uncharacterized damage-inducible protein DinB